MFELFVIAIYLSFIVDFVIWPIPSEVSTATILQKSDNKFSVDNKKLLLAYVLVLGIWLVPLANIIFFQWHDTSSSLLTQIIGALIAASGRLMTILASAALRRRRKNRIIKHSVFGISRHPIVTGLHLTLAGLLIIIAILPLWIPYIFTLFYFDRKVALEESNLRKFYGREYEDYIQSTPRYLIW